MITLLSENFVPLHISRSDLVLSSIAWGFTLGFGVLTTWTAIKQTSEVTRRYGYAKVDSPYIIMIWAEITVCTVFSVICWLHLNGTIPPSFAFYFVILTTWALQVQLLLQIIINRVSILFVDKNHVRNLKIGVAVFITAINISVYCIWIPARLQISERYIHINEVWDRCEKSIYLVTDAALNYYFVHIVKRRLVHRGLVKYDRLVGFNQIIIAISLSMDCLIIGMMSLNNSFVYMQFHPVAYLVKLKIEMSMADMIVKVATDKDNAYSDRSTAQVQSGGQFTSAFGTSQSVGWRMNDMDNRSETPGMAFNATREVHVTVERRESAATTSTTSSKEQNFVSSDEEGAMPLKEPNVKVKMTDEITGRERGMGMSTKIWAPPEEREAYP